MQGNDMCSLRVFTMILDYKKGLYLFFYRRINVCFNIYFFYFNPISNERSFHKYFF